MTDNFTTNREKNRKRMRDEYPYRGISDPNYKKDRKKLFMENGNGWWYFQGVVGQDNIEQYKKQSNKQKDQSLKTLQEDTTQVFYKRMP